MEEYSMLLKKYLSSNSETWIIDQLEYPLLRVGLILRKLGARQDVEGSVTVGWNVGSMCQGDGECE